MQAAIRRMIRLAGALALVTALGCLPPPPPGRVVVVRHPPPVRVERMGRAPGHGFVWIAGHWRWYRGDFDWVPGHWIRVPHGHSRWERGYWRHVRGGWVWIEGRWR